jgi:hypothetical protein
VLDSGALIALERDDRDVWRTFRNARAAGREPTTHGGIVGQVWRRGGPRQARLAVALAAIAVRPLDDTLGREAGRLLSQAGGSDVIDAAVVLLAENDDVILTSDPDDLDPLIETLGRSVELVVV